MTQIEPEIVKQERPGRAIAVVLVVLFLAAFAFPAGITQWIGEHCEGWGVCEAPLAAATAVEDISRELGVAGFFETAREETRRDLAIDAY